MAKEAQGEGHGDAKYRGQAAILDFSLEHGRQADHSESDDVIKQGDQQHLKEIAAVAHIAKAQHQLDQSEDESGDQAPAGAVPPGDDRQRQHGADGHAAAQRPGSLEGKDAQHRADGDEDGAFHHPSGRQIHRCSSFW